MFGIGVGGAGVGLVSGVLVGIGAFVRVGIGVRVGGIGVGVCLQMELWFPFGCLWVCCWYPHAPCRPRAENKQENGIFWARH